jgi:predicted ATP-binding protein involved in virulence
VSLIIEGINEHKGFKLSEPFKCQDKLIVLTGKNGSGKTRFLESTNNNQTSKVELQNTTLTSQQINLIPQTSLTPSFSSHYNDSSYDSTVSNTLSFFNNVKKDFDSPFDENKSQSYSRMSMYKENGIGYTKLYHLCQKISKKLDKPASQLTHDDIKLNFEDINTNLFGTLNISNIVNILTVFQLLILAYSCW